MLSAGIFAKEKAALILRKLKMKTLYNILLVCCLAGLLIVIGCRGSGSEAGVGGPAKDFRLDTLAHERFYLNQHRGQVVLLVFWSTWCSFCKEEMVELKSLQQMPDSANLAIAAICTDPENINDVQEIVKKLDIGYPVLLDREAKVFSDYELSVVPTTIVIDRAGNISLVRQGYSSAIMKQIRTKITDLLATEKSTK
jgi:peroxiredoxin